MQTGETSLLIFSQLFFTLFGALVNIVLGITLRDLPDLSCSTYYVILANISVCNLVICTFVKTILSIYVSYAFIKVGQTSSLQPQVPGIFNFRMLRKSTCSSAQCSR